MFIALLVIAMIIAGTVGVIGCLFRLAMWFFHLLTGGIFRPKPKPIPSASAYNMTDYYPEFHDENRYSRRCDCDHDDEDRWY